MIGPDELAGAEARRGNLCPGPPPARGAGFAVDHLYRALVLPLVVIRRTDGCEPA